MMEKVLFMIFECFSLFSIMRMHAQACVRWSKYTTEGINDVFDEPFDFMFRIVRQRVCLLIEAESRIDFGRISAQLSRYNRPTEDDGLFVFSIRERNVRTVLVGVFEQEYVAEKNKWSM